MEVAGLKLFQRRKRFELSKKLTAFSDFSAVCLCLQDGLVPTTKLNYKSSMAR